jgi:hypothetical protein
MAKQLYKDIRLVGAEEVVAWTLDFISIDLERQDRVELWKLSVDAYKHLRLWDISSPDGKVYDDPPRFKLKRLQKELRSAFDTFLKPFLTGEDAHPIVAPTSNRWPPKVFVVSEGEMFCTRLVNDKIAGEEVAVANFLDAIHALTPFPINRFCQCERCQRWFFPTGKRIRKERRFCSRACNLRETARRQRERIKKKKK